MGAAISMPDILTSIPNQATIYDKTYDTVVLMNRIIDFILKNADIADMVSLSSEEGCKKWIVVAESRLDTLFDRFRIQPDIGKDGILYLKRIDVVKKELEKTDSTGKKSLEHKQSCQVLAFFFVRLFQVVGALALSVIDTELPRDDYIEGKTAAVPYVRTGVPFLQKLPPKTFGKSAADKLKGWVGLGGYNKDVLKEYTGILDSSIVGNFHKLKSPNYTKPGATGNRLPQTIPNTNYTYGDIITGYFIKNKGNIYTINKYSDNLLFDMQFDDTRRLIVNNVIDNNKNLPIYIIKQYSEEGNHIVHVGNDDIIRYIINLVNNIPSNKNRGNIYIVLDSLKYINGNTINNTQISLINDPRIIINSEKTRFSIATIADDEKKTKITITFNIDLNVKPNNPLKYLVQIKNIKITPPIAINIGDKLKHVKDTSNKIYDPSITGDDEDSGSSTSGPIRNFTIGSSGIPTWNNLSIPEYLTSQFASLFKKIKKISVQGFSAMKEGYIVPLSDIKIQENYLKYSELWQELSKKPSIKAFCTARALQLLNLSGLARAVPTVIHPLVFSTKFPLVVNKSVPRRGERIIETPSFKSLKTLYDFPKDIMGAFPKTMQDDTSAKTKSLAQLILAFTEDTKPVPFDSIKEVAVGPQIISETDSVKIKGLREQAKKLFQEQFIHTKKVGILLKKLFILDNNITLNPKIMNRGIVGIEEIAREARDLLTDYYSKCQTEYNIGVKILTKAPATRATTI